MVERSGRFSFPAQTREGRSVGLESLGQELECDLPLELVVFYSHITKNPKVCGGNACIDGTRITVKDIVCLHEEDRTPEQMLDVYGTTLTLGQVHAALAYYYDHKQEIDASFADEGKIVSEHDRKRAEYLNRR